MDDEGFVDDSSNPTAQAGEGEAGPFGDFPVVNPTGAGTEGDDSWQVVSKPALPDNCLEDNFASPVSAATDADDDWGDFGEAVADGAAITAASKPAAAPDQPVDDAGGFGAFGTAEPGLVESPPSAAAPAVSGPADPFDVLSDPSKPLPDPNGKKKPKVNQDLEGDLSPQVLFDILLTTELLAEAEVCNRHATLAAALQDYKDQKARAAAEDRFEDAANLRDRINETEAKLESLPSLESLKKKVRETRRQGTTLERIVASLQELDSEVAATFRDRYCAGGAQWATMGLTEHARTDLGGALRRQRAAIRSANLYHTLKTSQRGNVWTETIRAIVREVAALEALLGEVEQQPPTVQQEVLDNDKLASYVAGVLEMVQVGHLIRASARDAIWRLPDDDGVLQSATDGLRRRLVTLQLTQFVAALEPRPRREPEPGAELCALSLQPIQGGEGSVAYGMAVCLAPCGNFFVNRVLRGSTTSLSGYVDVF